MSLGTQILGRRQVDPSVLATLLELQVEGNFPTGVHLVTVNLPISTEKGDLKQALYGSFLPIPDDDAFGPYDEAEYADEKLPGAVTVATSGEIELSKGRKRLRLRVTNTGDRPVQVRTPPMSLKHSAYPLAHCRSAPIITSSRPIQCLTSTG